MINRRILPAHDIGNISSTLHASSHASVAFESFRYFKQIETRNGYIHRRVNMGFFTHACRHAMEMKAMRREIRMVSAWNAGSWKSSISGRPAKGEGRQCAEAVYMTKKIERHTSFDIEQNLCLWCIFLPVGPPGSFGGGHFGFMRRHTVDAPPTCYARHQGKMRWDDLGGC